MSIKIYKNDKERLSNIIDLTNDKNDNYKKDHHHIIDLVNDDRNDKNDDDNFFSGLLSKIDSEIASNIMKSSGRF